VLILEMGARYAGNIDELCRIARPDIAVVTNVGLAHLESFGSVDVIAHTKGALIVRHLPPGGVAVLNGDDPRVRAMADRNDISVIHTGLSERATTCGPGRSAMMKTVVRLSCMWIRQEGAPGAQESRPLPEERCRSIGTGQPEALPALQEGGTERITMALLGRHSVENALLAAAAGLAMGLRLPTIRVALQKARPVAHRLELKKRNGVLVIDDAFNSNPVGARNAVSVLSEFRAGKKYVVTPG
jgi:UDP-N-acetylmuramoyl-tripeptide--D-alanyl-D-alanine ligase